MEISCIIVDDEPHSLELLIDYVNQIPYLKLIYSTTESLSALKYIQENNIDLVITDLYMPKLSGLSLFEKIKDKAKVIFITGFIDILIESLMKNAVDYLVKPVNFERFEQATKKVLLLNSTQNDFHKKENFLEILNKLSLLTPREKEVLKLIGEFKENKDIAKCLFISLNTVETHRLNINQKIGETNRKDLLMFALNSKLYL